MRTLELRLWHHCVSVWYCWLVLVLMITKVQICVSCWTDLLVIYRYISGTITSNQFDYFHGCFSFWSLGKFLSFVWIKICYFYFIDLTFLGAIVRRMSLQLWLFQLVLTWICINFKSSKYRGSWMFKYHISFGVSWHISFGVFWRPCFVFSEDKDIISGNITYQVILIFSIWD